jgi:hypothetical protein
MTVRSVEDWPLQPSSSRAVIPIGARCDAGRHRATKTPDPLQPVAIFRSGDLFTLTPAVTAAATQACERQAQVVAERIAVA